MHKRLQFFWLRWCANTSFCRKQVACAWLHTRQASKNAVLQCPAQNEIRRKDFHADPKAFVQAFLAIAEDKNKPPLTLDVCWQGFWSVLLLSAGFLWNVLVHHPFRNLRIEYIYRIFYTTKSWFLSFEGGFANGWRRLPHRLTLSPLFSRIEPLLTTHKALLSQRIWIASQSDTTQV